MDANRQTINGVTYIHFPNGEVIRVGGPIDPRYWVDYAIWMGMWK